jgi:chemotaxis protein methyltransferase CheR
MPEDPFDIEVELLLEAIRARYGYDLRGYSRGSMQRRVQAALSKSGLPHLGELQHRLLADAELFGQVLEDLTVRASEMFRDPRFFLAFRQTVVPVLRTYPQVRVWHSGCATGEEVYAAAIVLLEEGLLERTQIYGTDLSAQALAGAKQGVYRAEQLPAYATSYLEAGGKATLDRYYTYAYDRFAVAQALRAATVFFQHDLVTDHVFGEMHVVFCRNVLLYFGPELRARVVAKLAQSLCAGGFLCLGSSERMAPASGFTEVDREHRIYRRDG